MRNCAVFTAVSIVYTGDSSYSHVDRNSTGQLYQKLDKGRNREDEALSHTPHPADIVYFRYAGSNDGGYFFFRHPQTLVRYM